MKFYEEFGASVFDKQVMKKELPRTTYMEWKQATRKLGSLKRESADVIAAVMKRWAIDQGATHYCHWFQPLNGRTARKYDSFIDRTGNNEPITYFSAKELIKNESDASSFPNGGLRSTFEARGYTYWDCTANSFVLDHILYIPSIFVAYTGETLDKKLPLLKSQDYLSNYSTKVVNIISEKKAYRSRVKLGLEQEFFLITQEMYQKRFDLKTTSRTLFGRPKIRTQEQSQHYFGALPSRVMAFYEDVNKELWRLGVYVKTEHNEAAPAQFEIASIYSDMNVAIDQNHLIMQVLESIAQRHQLACLLHEKPFAHVNGSGKHNNYSIVTNEGMNLFDEEGEIDVFVVAMLAVIQAAKRYPALLRVGSSNVANDLRLGGDEAPPAIISIYLSDFVKEIIYNRAQVAIPKNSEGKSIEIDRLGQVPMDRSDRNRTSPFAFTGGKFEFRALGSSMSASDLNTALNTIIGASFEEIYYQIEGLEGDTLQEALDELIHQMLTENESILYDGDNYSAAWREEADRRGLPNYRTYLDGLAHWREEAQIFVEKGIFQSQEIQAMYEIMLEETISAYEIETNAMKVMVSKEILPLIESAMMRLHDVAKIRNNPFVNQTVDQLDQQMTVLYQHLEEIRNIENRMQTIFGYDRAIMYRDEVKPNLDKLREAINQCESMIGMDIWTIPTYEELFDSIKD